MLRAQVVLGTISGITNALAINSNNSAGQAYNAVLNTDSSVSLLQDGAILSGQGCPAFSGLSGGISSGAVYVDSAHNNIYLAMLSGVTLYAAYETIGLGTCTQGPLLELTPNALSNLEMNVDPVQGNVYILNSFGAFMDALYILPIASWSASSATKLNMDYSVPYGPIVIDPSNDVVYINDLGGNSAGTVGTYSTSGFFVYDPNYSGTPANNLQHVVGYNTSGGTPPTPFNVGTLLSNGSGELVLVNENPGAISGNLSVPITVLNATAPQTLFFTNTTKPYSYNNDVDITPGAAISTVSAASQYRAIGGADINAVSNVAYVFAFNSNALATPGLLLEYNLAPGAATPETVLSPTAGTATPSLNYSATWSRLNYNPESTELALSATAYSSGALGITSPLCAGTPLSLTQVAGSVANPVPIGYPVVNATSGYVYAIQSGGIDYVAPTSGCTASPPIQISPTTLYAGFPDESYFQNFTATGGSGTGYVWSITSGAAALNNLGLSFSSGGDLSGYPNAPGSYPFTLQVVDSLGNSTTQSYTLTIYPGFTVLPTSLPAGAVGTPYSQTFMASGGAGGPFSFSVISGTALSAVGLTLSPGGLISGTPSVTETAAPLTIKIADSLGYYTELNYTLTINSASSGPITVNDPETVTVNDSLTQVQLVDVSDPETITVTDIAVVTVSSPLTITGPASLPAGTVNVAYTATTITASGGTQPYVWSATGLPAGLSIGSASGVISGTPTADSGSPYSVTVKVTDSANPGNTATMAYTIAVEALPLTITTGLLPAGVVNVAYTATTITASGGTQPYSWAITGLPPGLTANGGGVISGTPTTSVGSPFGVIVKVTDSALNTVSMTYSLTVSGSLTIASPASLLPGTLNAAYTPTTISASGGLPPYTWTATGLPSGLTIAIATGVISGTPTADAGSPYSVTVTVEDSTGKTAHKSYTLFVEAVALTITSPLSLPPNAYEGVAFPPTQFSASGGSGMGYTWSVNTYGALPGLTLSNTGVLSGTPNGGFGPLAITVTVEDSVGDTATATYNVVFYQLYPLLITFPSSLTNADLNMGYSVGFGASGGTPPYTWSASGLPAGLNIGSSTGVLSGTPTVAGVFAVTVTVTDSFGYPSSVIYSLTVNPPLLTITADPPALTIPQGQSGQTTLTFTPTGGYNKMVTLSCAGLPANTFCSFTPIPNGTPINSYKFPGNDQVVQMMLTIQTDANGAQARTESAPAPPRPGAILAAIAFWCPGSLLGLIALQRKRKLFTKNPRSFGLCLFVLLVGAMAGLAGCISGGGFGAYVTPVGTSTVTVVVTPGSGSAQTLNIGVTITQQ